MRQLLIELRSALEFDGKDYRTESYPSIRDAIDEELAKPWQEPVTESIEVTQ